MKVGLILRVSKPARMGIDDASLYPLQPCLPRGLRSALLRKASVLRNWLLRKWDARQPSWPFPAPNTFAMLLAALSAQPGAMCADERWSHLDVATACTQGKR